MHSLCAKLLRSLSPPSPGRGEPDVRLGVRFEPASVVVPSGVPVNLRFRRDTAMAHGDAVIFPTLGRMATLPVGFDVDVTLPELAPGEYPFTAYGATPCGTLVVEAP